MKKVWMLYALLIAIPSLADEPSVKSQCDSGYKEFYLEGSKLAVCPNSDGSYNVDVTSVGGNAHTCWWNLTLTNTGSMFSAPSEDCELNVVFDEGKLNAQFIGACRYHCGARASFKSGDFIEVNPSAFPQRQKPEIAKAVKNDQPPQLWTGGKRIDGSIEACAVNAEQTLNSLGFIHVTKSIYETETYFYGNLDNNRAGIHCTSVAGRTFVFGSVAGSDVKTVESLRNKIFWKF